MESGGENGKICVSEVTKSLLESDSNCPYDFKTNKMISIPSLGKEVNSYFIDYKKKNRDNDSIHN